MISIHWCNNFFETDWEIFPVAIWQWHLKLTTSNLSDCSVCWRANFVCQIMCDQLWLEVRCWTPWTNVLTKLSILSKFVNFYHCFLWPIGDLVGVIIKYYLRLSCGWHLILICSYVCLPTHHPILFTIWVLRQECHRQSWCHCRTLWFMFYLRSVNLAKLQQCYSV